MFAARYYPGSYFARRYFPAVGATIVIPPRSDGGHGPIPERFRPRPPNVLARIHWDLPAFIAELEAIVTAPTVSASVDARFRMDVQSSGDFTMTPHAVKANVYLVSDPIELLTKFGVTKKKH